MRFEKSILDSYYDYYCSPSPPTRGLWSRLHAVDRAEQIYHVMARVGNKRIALANAPLGPMVLI